MDDLHQNILTAQGGVQHAYIHVPFCRSRCHYCDFYFELDKYGGQSDYLQALDREMTLRIDALPAKEPLKTIYLGGGTPSLLSPDHIEHILLTLKGRLSVADTPEITLEMNPEDVEATRVQGYLDAGINRFSIGIQSLDDVILKKVARRHNATQAIAAIHTLHDTMRQSGVTPNISVDVMYGLPMQGMMSYQHTLEHVVNLPIQHVSMYGLQLEAGTTLETLNTRLPNHYPLSDDAAHIDCYDWGVAFLDAHGFSRYEVSNFSKAGMESRHNLAYWSQRNYLALGPAAHGYLYPNRYSVPSNLHAYQAFQNLDTITVNESVSPVEHIENLLIFGLRTMRGVSMVSLESLCDASTLARLQTCLTVLLESNKLTRVDGQLRVNPRHITQLHDILVDIIGFNNP